MSLANLIEICTQEQQQSKDDFACFEILRRALEDQTEEAWQAFEAQFKGLIMHWVHQDSIHYGLNLINEEIEDVWSDTWANFVERYAIQRSFSENFKHIGAVLKILHKCIRSVLQNLQRTQSRSQKLDTALQQVWPEQTAGRTSALTEIEQADVQERLQEMIRRDIPEEELLFLLDLRFTLGLMPREIHQKYPERYASVRAVNNQLDKIMKRLRRRMDVYAELFADI